MGNTNYNQETVHTSGGSICHVYKLVAANDCAERLRL